MKKTRFNEKQILGVLQEVEAGLPIAEASRKHGVSEATIYNWRSKYDGLVESDLKKLHHLEQENRRLKHLYADLSLDYNLLKDVIAKKL